MKEIKMKAILKAYDEVRKAERNRDFHEKPEIKARFQRDAEQARERVIEARQAFETAAQPLTEAIRQAEGRSRERTIDAYDVCKGIKEVEERLQGITKKAMKDVVFGYDTNAQSFPAAYMFVPQSTLFRARFDGKEWRIIEILRYKCDNRKCCIRLTDEAKKAIIEKIQRF